MITGRAHPKNGRWYAIINLKDENGKYKPKWEALGLPEKGNKKKAEQRTAEILADYNSKIDIIEKTDILFCDFMRHWLDIKKSSISRATYGSYQAAVETKIYPYFSNNKINLQDLTARDIQKFYQSMLNTLSANSVKRLHANISNALKMAMKQDYIISNPVDKVELPRAEKYKADHYNKSEVNQLLEISKGTNFEAYVLFGSVFGLRRAEAAGVKWSAINFDENTITIDHTVTSTTVDGKRELIVSNSTKTKSSLRTLPIPPTARKILLELKKKQEENKKICGNSYHYDYSEYVCVNTLGALINPDYVTGSFKKFLAKNNMRPIRYHDLRHSCASVLLAEGISMKQIQEWMGHSDFSTTANIYAHLESDAKIASSVALEAVFEA